MIGFKTRLQLYTIPDRFYNTTRKLVLSGVDGLCFVADSQKAMQEANQRSTTFARIRRRSTQARRDPLVVQLNKRDLPNVARPTMIARLFRTENTKRWSPSPRPVSASSRLSS